MWHRQVSAAVFRGKRFGVRLGSLNIEQWDRWQPQIERYGVRHTAAQRPTTGVPCQVRQNYHEIHALG